MAELLLDEEEKDTQTEDTQEEETPLARRIRSSQEIQSKARSDYQFYSTFNEPAAVSGLSINAEQARPGVLASFAKGAAEGAGIGWLGEFGTRGLEPTELAETLARGGGTLATTLAIMAATRAPIYAGASRVFGASRLTGVTTEIVTGGVADSFYLLGNMIEEGTISKEDAGILLGANLLGGFAFPYVSPLTKQAAKETAKQVTEKGAKEVATDIVGDAVKQVEVRDFNVQTAPVKLDGNKLFKTPEAKDVYNSAETHFAGNFEVVPTLAKKYEAEKKAIEDAGYNKVTKPKFVFNEPEQVKQARDEYVARSYSRFLDEVGSVAPYEREEVINAIDNITADELTTISKQDLKDQILKNSESDWGKEWSGQPTSNQKWRERIREAMEDEQGNLLPVSKRSEQLSTAIKRLEDALIDGDKRLRFFVDPELPEEKFISWLKDVQDTRGQVIEELSNSSRLTALKEDIAQAIKSFKDDKIQQILPPGYSSRPVVKEFVESIDTIGDILKHDTSVMKSELEELSQQIKRTDKELVQRYTEGVASILDEQPHAEMKTLRQMMESLESGNYKDFMYRPADIQRLDTAMLASMERLMKNHPELLPEEIVGQVQQLEKQIPFMSTPEASQSVAQLEQVYRRQVSELLNNPSRMREVIDTTSDPNLRNVLETYSALRGDPTSVGKVKTYSQNPAKQIEKQLTERALHDEVVEDSIHYKSAPDAPHAEPAGGGGGKPPEDVFAHDLSPEDLEAFQSVNQNWFTRWIESPLTHAKVVLKKAPEKAKPYVQKAVAVYEEFAQSRRNYLSALAKSNKELDIMFERWRGHGDKTHNVILRTIEHISKKADELIRAEKSTDEIEDMITEYLGKQSGTVQEEYHAFRTYLDNMRDNTNNAIRRMNEELGTEVPEIPRRPGYIPFIYNGQWEMIVETADKKITKIIAEDNDELSKALNELFERGDIGSTQVNRIRMTPKWNDGLDDFDIADSVLKDGTAFDVNVSNLREAYKVRKTGFKPDTIGDVLYGALNPRNLGITELKQSVENAVTVSTRLGHRFNELAAPAIKMRQVAKELDEVNLHTLADDLRSYGNDVLGRSGDLERQVDAFFKHFFNKAFDYKPSRIALEGLGMHRNGRVVREVSSMLNFMGRMLTIGFNPITAMIQWTILPTNVAPILGYKNVMKGLRNIKRFADPDSRYGKLAQRANIFLKEPNESVASWIRGGKDEVRANAPGFSERVRKPRVVMSKSEQFADNAEYYSMFMFNTSEDMIRSASLYAGVLDGTSRAKKLANGSVSKLSHQDKRLQELARKMQREVTDEAVIDQYAIDMMFDLNFDFDVTGISRFARNPFTKVAAQFKTYFTQEMEFLLGRKMDISAWERFQAFAMFGGLGGIFALPFAEDLNTLATVAYGENPKLWLYEKAPDFVLFGIPAAAGVTFSDNIAVGGAKSLSGLTDMFDYRQGVALSKIFGEYDNIRKNKKGIAEGIIDMSSMGRKIQDGMEYINKGKRTSGYGVTSEGGVGAAIGEFIGFKTVKSKRDHELMRLSHEAKDAMYSDNRGYRREIFKSANEATQRKVARRLIREGKITPELAKSWFTRMNQPWDKSLDKDIQKLVRPE